MDHPLFSIVDDHIRLAEKSGAFDNLPGAGKPLRDLDDPADALVKRVMTEHKVKPPLVALKEEIAAAQARLRDLTDEAERKAEMRRLSDLQTRLALEVEAFNRYG